MNSVRTLVHAPYAYQKGYYGDNIGIAIVDSGLTPHPDYRDRIIGWYDTIHNKNNPYDDNGHGSHVAGIAAGNGRLSHGIYQGVAPRSNLIGLKVLNEKGNGSIHDILKALHWIRQHHTAYGIRIVNISIGSNDVQSFQEDCSLVQKVNELWDMGIVVVVAAGNHGPNPYTITAPGNSRKVITVGAIQLGNMSIPTHSGTGPTRSCIKKPDVVAPGFQIISCCPPLHGRGYSYSRKSGTSMATPVISGGLALLLSRYPDLSPREIKIRLKNSSTNLHLPHERQGWGLLHIGNLLNYH